MRFYKVCWESLMVATKFGALVPVKPGRGKIAWFLSPSNDEMLALEVVDDTERHIKFFFSTDDKPYWTDPTGGEGEEVEDAYLVADIHKEVEHVRRILGLGRPVPMPGGMFGLYDTNDQLISIHQWSKVSQLRWPIVYEPFARADHELGLTLKNGLPSLDEWWWYVSKKRLKDITHHIKSKNNDVRKIGKNELQIPAGNYAWTGAHGALRFVAS